MRLCAVRLRPRRRGGLRRGRACWRRERQLFTISAKVTSLLLASPSENFFSDVYFGCSVVREGLGGFWLRFSGKSLRLCFFAPLRRLGGHSRVLGVFTARSPDAWTGARAPTRASKPKRRTAKPKKAEHLRGDSARARGSTLYFTRIAAAPRGSGRTRARAPGLQCSQKWAPAGVERGQRRRTLTRWQRS